MSKNAKNTTTRQKITAQISQNKKYKIIHYINTTNTTHKVQISKQYNKYK